MSNKTPLLLTVLLLIPFAVFAGGYKLTGQLKTTMSDEVYRGSDIINIAGDGTSVAEGTAAARIMLDARVNSSLRFRVHYENSISKGENISAYRGLKAYTPYAYTLKQSVPDDSAQLFSLTDKYIDENDETAYQRLDRLFAEYSRGNYSVRFGRQALTWGHGKVFNPADFLNPFAPTDVIRDYKNGTDMLSLQTFSNFFSDIQAAVVPRRDTDTGDLKYSKSTAAAKLTHSWSSGSADMIFGVHYDEPVAGLGLVHDVGNATARADLLYADDTDRDYFTAVANIDYSWTAFGRNTYGYIEFYYDSLGAGSQQAMLADRELYERIERGDIYMRDRYYTAAGIQYELHPLVNLYASAIYNIHDGSYILQPRAVWDARENMRVTAGLDLPEGGKGSEFGGFTDRLSGYTVSPAKRAYLQVTFYF